MGDTKEFDVLILGSGSGLDVGWGAVEQGQSVAVVEKGRLGGTCLNRGCIPSKLLIHRADIAEQITDSERFGIDASLDGVHFSDITQEVNETVHEDSTNIEEAIRESDKMTLYDETCRFVDDRTVEVGGEHIAGKKVLVAAGARPAEPPIDGLESVDYLTSKEALALDEQPDRLVIIGGGYISAELGHFYGALGTAVTIIGRSDMLVKNEDKDVREAFTEAFAEKHRVHTGFEAESVSSSNGQITVEARNEDGDKITAEGDELLVATGRRPNTDTLNVEAAGIETDENGFVETNEYLETTAENVWALGDIAGNYMFKHSANLEAQYVYRNILGEKRYEVDYTGMGHAIFSSPQIAAAGRTEEELARDGIEYVVGRKAYEDVAMGKAFKERDGFVKVLVDSNDQTILGCHVLGPEASTLIHEVMVAMRSRGTASDVRSTIHIHPALNEVIRDAFNDAR